MTLLLYAFVFGAVVFAVRGSTELDDSEVCNPIDDAETCTETTGCVWLELGLSDDVDHIITQSGSQCVGFEHYDDSDLAANDDTPSPLTSQNAGINEEEN